MAGYDAPFSTQTSDSFTYHKNGVAYPIAGSCRAGRSSTTATSSGTPSTPYTGVKVPNNGVNIGIENQFGTSMQVKVWLR